MMKAIVFCFLLITLNLPAAELWPGLPYSEVRAYYFNDVGKNFVPIIKDGQLDASVVNKEGTLIPPAKVKALLAILNTKKYESLRPGCYSPRHGVIFYDRDKKVVAVYEVCFSCKLQRSEPEGIAPLTDLPAVAEIFEQLKLPLGPEGKSLKDIKKSWQEVSEFVRSQPIK